MYSLEIGPFWQTTTLRSLNALQTVSFPLYGYRILWTVLLIRKLWVFFEQTTYWNTNGICLWKRIFHIHAHSFIAMCRNLDSKCKKFLRPHNANTRSSPDPCSQYLEMRIPVVMSSACSLCMTTILERVPCTIRVKVHTYKWIARYTSGQNIRCTYEIT